MALRIRSRQYAGLKLLAVVERAADGLFWDAKALAWVAAPPADPAAMVPLAPVQPGGPWASIYRAAADTAGWQGNYVVYLVNAANGVILDGPLAGVLFNGDDAPAFPPATLTATGTFKLS